MGPPWSKRENGFVLTEAATGVSVYYEPHCDFEAASVARVGPVDVVVTPPCSQLLLGYALVGGGGLEGGSRGAGGGVQEGGAPVCCMAQAQPAAA